eukprot:CAMPEP_0176455064 /NCGR_PEP_ID=MMETSP0127-20121128/30377_1 /TAXON_ID=938130 /ORGANISM="Platyophrya macrostoma, Strain WH" /LENGTH=36 /DNA_ID= /DNA_START= /DNA_END= /DNA_ORIENTATION=
MNPLLLLGAFGGLAAVTFFHECPTYGSVFVTFAGWV